MKKSAPFTTVILAVTFLISICATSLVAQNNVKTSNQLERDRMSRIMDPGTNVEEFRQEYLNYLSEMESSIRLFNEIPVVREKLNRSGLRPLAMFPAAKVSVSEMSPEDLTQLRAVYARFPGWRDAPKAIDGLIKPELRQALELNRANKGTGIMVANAGTTDDCAAAITAGFTNTDISIAAAVSLAGHAAADAVPPVLNIPAIAVWAAADATLLGIQTSKNIRVDCEADAFQADITGKVVAIPGLISTSTSTTAGNITTSTNTTATNISASTTATATNIVNARNIITLNDNANTLTILTAIEASKATIIADARGNKDEVKNLLLRTQIEADLASTDGSTFVALYETPSDVCVASLNDKGLPQLFVMPGLPTVTIQQCGLLDLVRSIVRDTISNVGAGTNAQSFFTTGDAQKTAGQYKAAYASYRKAYKAAAK